MLTMDLHAAQIQGFSLYLDHLLGVPILAQHYLERGFEDEDVVIVSPDIGSVTRARNIANRLNAPIAIVDKRRPRANVAEVMNIIGRCKEKVLLVDDMIDTAGTLVQGAEGFNKKWSQGSLCLCYPWYYQDQLLREYKIPLSKN